ncbi:MAG: hypothetical protein ACQESG_08015, partial [Nanobdellota archaeon]
MRSALQKTIEIIRKEGIRLSGPILSDLVGLVVFIFVNGVYMDKISVLLTSFSMHVSRNMDSIMGDLLTTKDIFALISRYP